MIVLCQSKIVSIRCHISACVVSIPGTPSRISPSIKAAEKYVPKHEDRLQKSLAALPQDILAGGAKGILPGLLQCDGEKDNVFLTSFMKASHGAHHSSDGQSWLSPSAPVSFSFPSSSASS